MKVFRNFAIAIVVVLFGNMFYSMIYEVIAMRTEYADMVTLANLAYSDVTIGMQQIDSRNLGKVQSEWSAEELQELNSYTSSLLSQATTMGLPSNSMIKRVVKVIKDSIARPTSLYTPLQFGLTYLTKNRYIEEYRKSLETFVNLNYASQSDTKKFSGDKLIHIKYADDVKITIGAPQLLRVKGGTKEEQVIYKSIFGVEGTDAADMVAGAQNAGDSLFTYIVAYDIKVEIEWKHATKTPFFRNLPFAAGHCDEYNQLLIPGKTIELNRRYVLTN